MSKLQTMASKRPDLAFLLKHTESDVVFLEDDIHPRVMGFLRMDKPEVRQFLRDRQFEKNRTITAKHVKYLESEAGKDRLVPTNVLALVEDADHSIHVGNGNHTLCVMEGNEDKARELTFSWTLWLNDTNESEMVARIYNRYDAGLRRTPKQRMDAISASSVLGLSEKETAILYSITSVILGRGRNTPTPENELLSRSSDDRLEMMTTYLPAYRVYLELMAKLPTSSPTGVHTSSGKILRHIAVAAALVVAVHETGNERFVEVLEQIARADFEEKSPAHVLWRFFFDEKSAWHQVSGGSKYPPIFIATLLSMKAQLGMGSTSFRTANSLVPVDERPDNIEKNITFGDESFSYRTWYRKKPTAS